MTNAGDRVVETLSAVYLAQRERDLHPLPSLKSDGCANRM